MSDKRWAEVDARQSDDLIVKYRASDSKKCSATNHCDVRNSYDTNWKRAISRNICKKFLKRSLIAFRSSPSPQNIFRKFIANNHDTNFSWIARDLDRRRKSYF